MRTEHSQRVLEFMLRAKQECPMVPSVPNESVRVLRAKLILEEALETIEALGVTVDTLDGHAVIIENLQFTADKEPNLIEIADGCADVSVVTMGTLIACGIQDSEILRAVDKNNLMKFGPGHSYREDGKLIKPPGHTKVNLWPFICAQELL